MSYLQEWHEAAQEHPQWTTRAEADFINALCPASAHSFPNVPGTEHVSPKLSSLFEDAYRTFQEVWRADLVRVAGICGKNEMQVLIAIERKTLGFGKLLEKMPQRLLTVGEINPRTGQPRLRPNGAAILPPTGIHRRNLGRAVAGLVEKRLITRVPSDPHPRYGVSSIYSPSPIDQALTVIVHRAHDLAAAEPNAEELIAAIELVTMQINEALINLLDDEAGPNDPA